MPLFRRPTLATALFLAATTAACGGSSGDAPASGDAPGVETPAGASVTIAAPAEGAEVDGPDVTIELAVDGVEVRRAGDMTPGTGHHHLYLDADLTPAGQPVPTVEGSIVHMGDGSTRYTFRGIAPGAHRVIAVVGDGVHVPLVPWVVDTVTFTVR